MDISISLGGYLDLFDKPKYNKECGWDACELPLGGFFLNGGRFDDIDNVTDEEMEEFFTSLRKRAEECGFYFGQTHSHFDGHIREKYYKGGYEEAVKKEIACVKATHWLGANKMVSHPHMLMTRVYEFNIPESFEQAATFYKRLAPALEQYDVYCCMENMFGWDRKEEHIAPIVFSHVSEIVQMCEYLGPRYKICLDIGHCTLTQDDPATSVRIAGDKLYALHCHDNDGLNDLHTMAFMPQSTSYIYGKKPLRVDLHELMQALKDVDYKGTLNFETGAPGPAELHEPIFRWYAKIARYLADYFEACEPKPFELEKRIRF